MTDYIQTRIDRLTHSPADLPHDPNELFDAEASRAWVWLRGQSAADQATMLRDAGVGLLSQLAEEIAAQIVDQAYEDCEP